MARHLPTCRAPASDRVRRLLTAALLCVLPAAPASAAPVGEDLSVGGYVQTWITVHEQLENGIRQAGSGDDASQSASGFSIRRARVHGAWSLLDGDLTCRIEVKFEGGVDLTDCYASLRLSDAVSLSLGQMKIPSTYEVLTPTFRLSFVQPSTLSGRIADWSLSRTPYISTFMGNRSYLRDLGLGVRGNFAGGRATVFGMVGNGLGANLFVGGRAHKQFIVGNSPGDLFYGLRVDLRPAAWLSLGGHGAINRHANSLFNDEKTVIDLRRWSGSFDAAVDLPRGIRMGGMVGGGVVDDDFYRDDRTNYEYAGWEARATAWLRPRVLEAGLRFDRYRYEYNDSGVTSTQDNWTVGVNHYVRDVLRTQVNYTHKRLDSLTDPELDDDVLLVNVQVLF